MILQDLLVALSDILSLFLGIVWLVVERLQQDVGFVVHIIHYCVRFPIVHMVAEGAELVVLLLLGINYDPAVLFVLNSCSRTCIRTPLEFKRRGSLCFDALLFRADAHPWLPHHIKAAWRIMISPHEPLPCLFGAEAARVTVIISLIHAVALRFLACTSLCLSEAALALIVTLLFWPLYYEVSFV
jgi:hypothetical protein